MPDRTPRVAVIGAGPAGLATLKALADQGIRAVCFDAGDRVGGLWVFGAPHSSAYRTLHLNTSRGRTEFADHPMPAHWPDYPDHARVAGYLAGYADAFGLTGQVRFGHTVTRVAHRPDGTWELTATRTGTANASTTPAADADTRLAATSHGTANASTTVTGSATAGHGTVTEVFDAVVVANGHNSRPRPAAYPGEVTAAQLHSHDYRDPAQLAGKRVLVVGGGNSAMDIAVDASHVAASTLLSLRRGVWIVPKHLLGKPSDTLNGALAKRLPWRARQRISQTMLRLAVGSPVRYGLPAPSEGFLQDHPTLSDGLLSRLSHGEIEARPGIERIDGDTVSFVDGTRAVVDLIVWCTGYRIDLPFLDPALLGPGADRMPLYRRVFHLDVAGLMFVGLIQSTGAALPVVEAQARLVAAHLAGKYALPAAAAQRADCDAVLRKARRRWGERRPAMRIDFDAYLELASRELREGVRRHRRGLGISWSTP